MLHHDLKDLYIIEKNDKKAVQKKHCFDEQKDNNRTITENEN